MTGGHGIFDNLSGVARLLLETLVLNALHQIFGLMFDGALDDSLHHLFLLVLLLVMAVTAMSAAPASLVLPARVG